MARRKRLKKNVKVDRPTTLELDGKSKGLLLKKREASLRTLIHSYKIKQASADRDLAKARREVEEAQAKFDSLQASIDALPGKLADAEKRLEAVQKERTVHSVQPLLDKRAKLLAQLAALEDQLDGTD